MGEAETLAQDTGFLNYALAIQVKELRLLGYDEDLLVLIISGELHAVTTNDIDAVTLELVVNALATARTHLFHLCLFRIDAETVRQIALERIRQGGVLRRSLPGKDDLDTVIKQEVSA